MEWDNGQTARRRWKIAAGVLAIVLLGEPNGCKYIAVAQAAGGPIEKLCDRYCDPVIDWAETKIKNLRDGLTNTPQTHQSGSNEGQRSRMRNHAHR